MTDPRDAMLDAARALHERYEYDPSICGTCGDINNTRIPWPCPTALALGATGRSEWTTPKPPPSLRQCTSHGPNKHSCFRETNHDGNHQDTDMNQWNDNEQSWDKNGEPQ